MINTSLEKERLHELEHKYGVAALKLETAKENGKAIAITLLEGVMQRTRTEYLGVKQKLETLEKANDLIAELHDAYANLMEMERSYYVNLFTDRQNEHYMEGLAMSMSHTNEVIGNIKKELEDLVGEHYDILFE
ncbi:MAG: hypothetical protein IKZ01_00070 [Anaerotignum sp.]|nr:hypothetical protein [Anaerotignum sp.]